MFSSFHRKISAESDTAVSHPKQAIIEASSSSVSFFHVDDSEVENDVGSVHGVRSLFGASSVSLDGQSLTLPVSSDNPSSESAGIYSLGLGSSASNGEKKGSEFMTGMSEDPLVDIDRSSSFTIGVRTLQFTACQSEDDMSSINSHVYLRTKRSASFQSSKNVPYGSKLKIIGSTDKTDTLELGSSESYRRKKKAESSEAEEVNIPDTIKESARDESFQLDEPERARSWSNEKSGSTTPEEETELHRFPPFFWILDAPKWLQVVVFISASLVLLSVIAVAVTVSIILTDRSVSESSNSVADSNIPLIPESSSSPSWAPTSWNVTTELSNSPSYSSNTPIDFANSPSYAPSIIINSNYSTDAQNLTFTVQTSFALTAGQYREPLMDSLPILLPAFTSNDNESTTSEMSTTFEAANHNLTFLVHLGDWNSPEATSCDASAYESIASEFSISTVPVYFIPGDNEYNDCVGREKEALEIWRDTFVNYESTHWTLPYDTQVRQEEQIENFAFTYQNIIFVGLNLVSGYIYDQSIWDARLQLDLAWVEQAYEQWHNSNQVMVLFCHSPPENQFNALFFDALLTNIEQSWMDVEFILFNRHRPGQVYDHTDQYNGIANLQVVTVEGSVWPPLLATITIDTLTGNVIVLTEQDVMRSDDSAAVNTGT